MSFRTILFTGALVSTALAFSACEWSGGSDGGFNTSKVDFNANISGQYTGLLAGGKAVAVTSGAPITRLLIQQTGNAVEVTDTFGNKYRGQVGAPGAIGDFGTIIPSGASVASFQVGWRGTDNTAGREVEFSGVINLITVENVQGDTSTQTTSSNNSNSSDATRANGSSSDSASTSANTSNSTSGSTDGTTSDSTTATTGTGAGGDPGSTQTITVVEPTGNGTTNVTTVVTTTPGDNITVTTGSGATTSATTDSTSDRTSDSGNTSDSTRTSAVDNSSTQSSQNASDSTRTITSTFSISEGNAQFRLQGTWIEQGGLVAQVEARSPATASVLTTTTAGN